MGPTEDLEISLFNLERTHCRQLELIDALSKMDTVSLRSVTSTIMPQLENVLTKLDAETIAWIKKAVDENYKNTVEKVKEKYEKENRKKEILDKLKASCIREPCDVLWLKWESITITLPEIWDFKWFSFTLRKSDEIVENKYLEKYPEFEKEGCDEEYIWEILQAINKYLRECWIETDWDVDYLNRMKAYDYPRRMWSSAAWECINYLMELGDYDEKGYHGDWYWMNGISDNCQEFLCCAWRMFQFQHIGRSRCKVLCKGK